MVPVEGGEEGSQCLTDGRQESGVSAQHADALFEEKGFHHRHDVQGRGEGVGEQPHAGRLDEREGRRSFKGAVGPNHPWVARPPRGEDYSRAPEEKWPGERAGDGRMF